jgi:hypothetical protein
MYVLEVEGDRWEGKTSQTMSSLRPKLVISICGVPSRLMEFSLGLNGET